MADESDTGPAEVLALLASHEERSSTLKATRVREQFFPLLETVVTDPTAVVYVEHKGLPGRAMLVGEAYQRYVRQLEHAVRVLLAPPTETTFQLAGSLTLDSASGADEVGQALDALRAEEAKRAEAKFAAL